MPVSFKEGDLVWAKMRGYPTWPGKIIDAPHSQTRPNHQYVFFFGTLNHAWVRSDNIHDYSKYLHQFERNIKQASYQDALISIAEQHWLQNGGLHEPAVDIGANFEDSLLTPITSESGPASTSFSGLNRMGEFDITEPIVEIDLVSDDEALVKRRKKERNMRLLSLKATPPKKQNSGRKDASTSTLSVGFIKENIKENEPLKKRSKEQECTETDNFEMESKRKKKKISDKKKDSTTREHPEIENKNDEKALCQTFPRDKKIKISTMQDRKTTISRSVIRRTKRNQDRVEQNGLGESSGCTKSPIKGNYVDDDPMDSSDQSDIDLMSKERPKRTKQEEEERKRKIHQRLRIKLVPSKQRNNKKSHDTKPEKETKTKKHKEVDISVNVKDYKNVITKEVVVCLVRCDNMLENPGVSQKRGKSKKQKSKK